MEAVGSEEQARRSEDPGSATAPDPDLTPRQKEAQENPQYGSGNGNEPGFYTTTPQPTLPLNHLKKKVFRAIT
jgi:hypothetical protein